MTQIFGVMLLFDSIRFVGQGHGSKFKVTGGKCCFFAKETGKISDPAMCRKFRPDLETVIK